MTNIIPSIISPNLKIINEKLERVLGLVKRVQIDITDGEYAPSKTWPFVDKNSDDLVKLARGQEKFPHIEDFIFEADLMIYHPIEYLVDFISIGIKSFVIHIDSTDHINECIETIKNSGCKVGLGIKPSVDTELLEPFLTKIDFVQFMGNDKIGHSGAELMDSAVEKIESFHKKQPLMPLQIDIGVNEKNILKLKEVGITSFISNSAIFDVPDTKEALKKLQNL